MLSTKNIASWSIHLLEVTVNSYMKIAAGKNKLILCQKNTGLGKTGKMGPFLNRSCLYSYLTSCCIIWTSTYHTYLYFIYMSKLFVRIATSLKSREPSLPLFGELQTITIYDINILQLFLITRSNIRVKLYQTTSNNIFKTMCMFILFQLDKQVCSILHLLAAPEGSICKIQRCFPME